MAQSEVFVALVVAVVLVALAARRLERVPHAVALVVGGIVAGLLPVAPQVRLDPNLIFVAFLPPILFPSAFDFAFEDVRSNLRPIGLLALGLVPETVVAVAAARAPRGAARALNDPRASRLTGIRSGRSERSAAAADDLPPCQQRDSSGRTRYRRAQLLHHA